MKITFAGQVLADWTSLHASGIRLNGQALYDAVPVPLAATQRLFPRGNKLVPLSFTVERSFASLLEAQKFCLTYFSGLTCTGNCLVLVGESSAYEEVYLNNAILSAAPTEISGVCVTVSYEILAPSAVAATPGEWVAASEEDMILRGSQSIASGAETAAVIFSSAFASTPSVAINVRSPLGGSTLFCCLDGNLSDETGFTANLSAPAPASGYELDWIAIG